MNSEQANSQSLISATVLAAGIATLWAVIVSWLLAFGVRFVSSRDNVTESLDIARDGTPVISVQSSKGFRVVLSRRTLNGDAWPNDYEAWLRAAYLAAEARPPGIVRFPRGWHVGGTHDFKQPPTVWYVVSGNSPGLYLAGFDGRTKVPIGYIGTNGFREALPAESEYFEAPGPTSLTDQTVTSGFLQTDEIVFFFPIGEAEPMLPPWLVYLIDGQRLCEIDLRRRTVRTVTEIQGMVSIALVQAPVATVRDRTEVTPAPTAASDHDGLASGQTSQPIPDSPLSTSDSMALRPARSEPIRILIAVRTRDRICIVDPMRQATKEFRLPVELQNVPMLMAFWTSPDQLLVRSIWSDGNSAHLTWLAEDGTVSRQESLELRDRRPLSPRQVACRSAAAIPVPGVLAIGLAIMTPLAKMQWNQVDRYGDGLQQSIQAGWPAFVVLIIITSIMMWLVLRTHRARCRAGTWRWVAFVGLLGLPGWLAYLLEFRRPKVEECPQCHEGVPRDRDACANCGNPFPASALSGIEIYDAV